MSEILLEVFGSIGNDELRSDDVSLEDAMGIALQRLADHPVLSREQIETIYTGMDQDVTYALQDAVESLGLDIEIQPFYPNVNNIQEEDDVDYQKAWKTGYTWRNNVLFSPSDDADRDEPIDAVVRVGDAGGNGAELLRHARRKSVLAIDLNLDEVVDREQAYNSGSEDAETAEASA